MRFRPFLALSILSNKQTQLYSTIKNVDKPACNTCKFYNPEEFTNFDSTSSKCLLYGNKNLHDGNIEYLYATECRKNESTCGEEGKLYEKENNIYVKKIYHNFSTYKFFYFIIFLYSSLFFLNYK